jgi:hypothetical protein
MSILKDKHLKRRSRVAPGMDGHKLAYHGILWHIKEYCSISMNTKATGCEVV